MSVGCTSSGYRKKGNNVDDWLINAARRPIPEKEQPVILGIDFGAGDTVAVAYLRDGELVVGELPDGLYQIVPDGFLYYDCNVCDCRTIYEGEIKDFVFGARENVCGGTPRCSP